MATSASPTPTKPRLSPFEAFFAWLAGAGGETLAQCPDWERRKHASFGATVLIPTVFGFAASAYAASTITTIPALIFGIATIWALIILTIDRAFLAAYRPGMPPKQKTTQFFLRFTIALLMGFTVAHPLVLLLFKDAVALEITASQDQKIKEKRAEIATQTAELDAQISVFLASLADLRTQQRATFDPVQIANDSPGQGATSQPDHSEQLTLLEQQIASQSSQLEALRKELDRWKAEYDNEIAGKGASGTAGIGPRARAIKNDELDWRTADAKRLSGSITQLTQQKTKLFEAMSSAVIDPERKQLATAALKAKQAQIEQYAAGQTTIRQSIQDQIDSATAEIERLRAQRAKLTGEGNTLADAPPPTDLISRTFALHSLFHKPGGAFALSSYIVLSLVFIVLDTIPLVAKFSAKKGPYDLLIEYQENTFEPANADTNGPSVPVAASTPSRPPNRSGGGGGGKGYANSSNRSTVQQSIRSALQGREVKPMPTPVPKPVPSISSIANLQDGHPIAQARQFKKLREYYPSNNDLAEAVNLKPATLSKYFKLLKMPPDFQVQLEAIQDISLENAYRIACVDDVQDRAQVLELARAGATQTDIRNAIARLKAVA